MMNKKNFMVIMSLIVSNSLAMEPEREQQRSLVHRSNSTERLIRFDESEFNRMGPAQQLEYVRNLDNECKSLQNISKEKGVKANQLATALEEKEKEIIEKQNRIKMLEANANNSYWKAISVTFVGTVGGLVLLGKYLN